MNDKEKLEQLESILENLTCEVESRYEDIYNWQINGKDVLKHVYDMWNVLGVKNKSNWIDIKK